MRVYVCTDHDGHWPVGVATVVVAETPEEASLLLAVELAKRGLDGRKGTLQEIDLTKPAAHVLRDGDY